MMRVATYLVVAGTALVMFHLGRRLVSRPVGMGASILYLLGPHVPQFDGYFFITEPYANACIVAAAALLSAIALRHAYHGFATGEPNIAGFSLGRRGTAATGSVSVVAVVLAGSSCSRQPAPASTSTAPRTGSTTPPTASARSRRGGRPRFRRRRLHIPLAAVDALPPQRQYHARLHARHRLRRSDTEGDDRGRGRTNGPIARRP